MWAGGELAPCSLVLYAAKTSRRILGQPGYCGAAPPGKVHEIDDPRCAACHTVSADQKHGADAVPSFASIAQLPGFSPSNIAQFLMNPHPKMPDMQLTRDEAGGSRRLYRKSRALSALATRRAEKRIS